MGGMEGCDYQPAVISPPPSPHHCPLDVALTPCRRLPSKQTRQIRFGDKHPLLPWRAAASYHTSWPLRYPPSQSQFNEPCPRKLSLSSRLVSLRLHAVEVRRVPLYPRTPVVP